ncbi:hypothetical protein QQS21_006996 [Conoideocrella luteorostrata]|uniref:Alpha/beta-hydrolase n=1 Tax=Conoideocrella luteorostrata TaxID=1105319 RepID=A0AAJ0CQX2_9HYPO|nr:hypothetical protein QQS21_006996 [Conoideocrella luteorostrata]
MHEKLWREEAHVSAHRAAQKQSGWRIVVISIVASLWMVSSWRFLAGSKPNIGPAKPEVRRYPGEKIQWEPCGSIDDHELECSEISVPMDQFNATNSGDKTFEIPLIRLRGKNATENMVLNPGGPGGGGIGFVREFGKQLNVIVGENYHLLSFDPRGVNSSRPLAACYPDEETKTKFHFYRDGDLVRDSPRRYAWSTNYAKACAENMGEHGKYMNTPQTAADMNSILDAIGQQDMVYWGFSYGSLLGQTYAGMYRERSKRVIIDGVVNQFEWYTEPILSMDYIDTYAVVEGFFDECFKAGDDCALAKLGTSAQHLKETVFHFMDQLADAPIAAYENASTYGLIDYNNLWIDGFFRATYKPSNWPTFAQTVANLMNGNTTDALMSFTFSTFAKIQGDATDVVALNDGASGAKFWPQGRREFLDKIMPYYKNSSIAASTNRMYSAKQQWLIPRTHDYVPRRGVETAHPLLILSTTYDPVCPLAAARTANDAFVGSKLAELKAYGHCSLAMPSLCVARHVRNYLRDGTLPEEGATCEVDALYFGKRNMMGRAEKKVFEMDVEEEEDEEDDERVLQAQMEIGRGMEWLRSR